MSIPSVSNKRLTRAERRDRIRADLVDTAGQVFLERGYHGASLEEIALEAGVTKGAVYSNFASKDDLFLAVCDRLIDDRVAAYSQVVLKGRDFDESVRATARFMVDAASQTPTWNAVLIEFWTFASRRPELRDQIRRRHERFLEGVSRIVVELAERHDIEYRLPVHEAVRGSVALARGMGLERLVDPDLDMAEVFVEMFAAYMNGLTTPRRKEST